MNQINSCYLSIYISKNKTYKSSKVDPNQIVASDFFLPNKVSYRFIEINWNSFGAWSPLLPQMPNMFFYISLHYLTYLACFASFSL